MSLSHPRLATAIVALLTIAACSSPTEPRPRPALTALPRALTPAEQSIIAASNGFSFALFDTVASAQPDSNIFLSPLSASMALGMTMNGAANRTYDEMRTALQFGDATQGDIDEGYRSLIALLTSLDPSVQMRIANAIWYSRTFGVYQGFLDTSRTYFDAEVQPLDFRGGAGTLATVNGWVNAKTNGCIPTILESVDPSTLMLLVDAIYFKGDWRARFDPAQTRADRFTDATGASQPMQLMHRHGAMSYAAGSWWQAVDLPYGDSAFSMTVVLPDAGVSVASLVDSLTPAFWTALTSRLRTEQVDLYLPKLTLKYDTGLDDALRSLGMRAAFVPGEADFTRMSAMGAHVIIDTVKQKSWVSVDEKGTEAAAVSVVEIVPTSAPQELVMRVDRPYVFVIRERLSGTIVFMGRIVSMPAA